MGLLRRPDRSGLLAMTKSALFRSLRAPIYRGAAISYHRMKTFSTEQNLTEWTLRTAPEVIISRERIIHGYNPYFLTMGTLSAFGARLLGDRELRIIAERVLDWVLGANPRAMSFMNGVGYRRVNKHPLFCNRQGRDYKWGITTGIWGPRKGEPPNFPHAGLSEEGGHDSNAEETWTLPTGLFVNILTQLLI